jgi:hypothetical protein
MWKYVTVWKLEIWIRFEPDLTIAQSSKEPKLNIVAVSKLEKKIVSILHQAWLK